ncbi:hypothetical protein [Plantactinospora sonchi]|uniref:WXG100 family type VII secretion target n=1 Tax=Plantactinospora sonchi TaxID=1544735 RepID=A0ABU7RL90_9ACTN
MSEQELWLDPGQAQRSGTDLAYAGKAVTAQHDGMGAEIRAASANRPWGKDEIGEAFEQRYRGFETTIFKAWQSVGRYVETLGVNVTQSVQASVQTDAASAQRIQHIDR